MAKLGPYELNSIVTGDARELAKAIPSDSVDLIFTDPVYDRIEDYAWLAETAARVLKPDRALLCFCGIEWQFKTQQTLAKAGREITWILPIVYSAGNTPRFHQKGFAKWTMLLWCGGSPVSTFCDAQISTYEKQINGHRWTKNVKPIKKYLEAFSDSNDIILDPFTGGGTVPAVCKQLNRQYLAFEIDPDTADLARQRVANTQPPLPLVYPEQLPLIAEVK
jgi:DNA modification methylase